MSLFVDLKYINSISHLLRNFKRKSDYLWNFSCPICGDSAKNKIKARGYIYRKDARDALNFKCHNNGCQMSFGDLIKHLDEETFKQYVFDSFLEKKGGDAKKTEAHQPFKKKKIYKPIKPTALVGCPSISILGPDHMARKYIQSRKLPEAFLKQIFWTDDFPALVDKVSPGHQFALRKEERIIIPFLDKDYQLLAIQGRSVPEFVDGKFVDKPNTIRYITIKSFEDAPRIYGQHRLGKVWKRIYVVEGPFDSMFLPNCLAMAGSDIPEDLPVDKTLVVYDNEPRKKATCEKIAKAIQQGYRVCIWPKSVAEKDINQMILTGHTAEGIRTIIDRNSFAGIEAENELGKWRKD